MCNAQHILKDVFTNSSPSSSPYSLVSSEVLHDAAQKVRWKAGLLGTRSGRAPRGPVRGMRLVECRIFVHTFCELFYPALLQN